MVSPPRSTFMYEISFHVGADTLAKTSSTHAAAQKNRPGRAGDGISSVAWGGRETGWVGGRVGGRYGGVKWEVKSRWRAWSIYATCETDVICVQLGSCRNYVCPGLCVHRSHTFQARCRDPGSECATWRGFDSALRRCALSNSVSLRVHNSEKVVDRRAGCINKPSNRRLLAQFKS